MLGAGSGFAPADAASGTHREVELPRFKYQRVHLVPTTTFAPICPGKIIMHAQDNQIRFELTPLHDPYTFD